MKNEAGQIREMGSILNYCLMNFKNQNVPEVKVILAATTSLCAKAKVKKFTFYALRHYGALTLANSGKASLREIQHMLRHRRPTTTDNYLKGLKPELKTPAKILGDVLPKV